MAQQGQQGYVGCVSGCEIWRDYGRQRERSDTAEPGRPVAQTCAGGLKNDPPPCKTRLPKPALVQPARQCRKGSVAPLVMAVRGHAALVRSVAQWTVVQTGTRWVAQGSPVPVRLDAPVFRIQHPLRYGIRPPSHHPGANTREGVREG